MSFNLDYLNFPNYQRETSLTLYYITRHKPFRDQSQYFIFISDWTSSTKPVSYVIFNDNDILHYFSRFKPLTTPSDGSSSYVTGCARSFASISSFQRPSTLVSWSSSSGRQGRRQIPHKPEVMEVEAALVHVSKGLPRTHSLDLG